MGKVSDNDLENLLDNLTIKLPKYLEIIKLYTELKEKRLKLHASLYLLSNNEWEHNSFCQSMHNALKKEDKELYSVADKSLLELNAKKESCSRRQEFLERIDKVAPGWCASSKARSSIHGLANLPEDMLGAWKGKQGENRTEERRVGKE